jgi:hypothetical protein
MSTNTSTSKTPYYLLYKREVKAEFRGPNDSNDNSD